ncbi:MULTISPECIES: hypothetical protein [Spirosoma]|uniref:Uncharacterized protein n=1 Tax=Spirosoma liriopis TaxID=2937440 RepID=A0ABT0HP76_9BACT|nr:MULTISPECIES: hypothetical protein [Spirosoma]MCK8493971.1 hypothetical protein [Spirosoma liriopis]UHG88992.1 hypothetical protein LQ777_12110 [Spirosoma oryzicola]
MKSLLLMLLATGFAYAQLPATTIRRDSLPDTQRAMPTLLPANSFYRQPTDPDNVVRATLDNMPVKIPDSSTYYTLQRYRPSYPPDKQTPMPGERHWRQHVPKKP